MALYCRLTAERPEHSSTHKLMGELGLTPAALQRLRLVVEATEEPQEAGESPYGHLMVV